MERTKENSGFLSRKKPDINICTQEHFEKNFKPLLKDNSNFDKLLEDMDQREYMVELYDSYDDFDDNHISHRSDIPQDSLDYPTDPFKDSYHFEDPEEKVKKFSDIILGLDWPFYKDNLFLDNNLNYTINKEEVIDLTGKADILFVVDSSRSSLYYAYEMYRIIVENSLPPELNGKKIKIIITHFDNHLSKEFSHPQLNPNTNPAIVPFQNNIFYSIFTKYKGRKKDIKRFLGDILFRYNPKEIILRRGNVPYDKSEPEGVDYSPTNIVYFGDLSKSNIKLVADNIHSQRNYSQEEFNKINTFHLFNYLCTYSEENLNKVLYKLYPERTPAVDPKLLEFNDIIRISFDYHITNAKKRNRQAKASSDNEENSENDLQDQRRYLIYSRDYDAYSDVLERNIRLDDILEAIPTKTLQPIAKELRLAKKEILQSPMIKNLNEVELTSLKLNTGLLNSTDYSTQDVFNQTPITFIIINDSSIPDFENDSTEENIIREKNNLSIDIMRRGIERGFYITTKYFCKKDLPLEDIYAIFDAFIYSPFLNSKSFWKEDNRFLPECYYHNKNVYFGPETKTFNLHPGLRFRIDLAKNHAFSLRETQVRFSEIEKTLYRSKIINNLLGYWGY